MAGMTEYAVNFDRTEGVVETTRRKHDHTEVKRFLASHPLGPIGGCLLALSQPIKIGDSMTLDVFAATERYVVQFRVARREQIHVGADDVDTFRVIPTMLYVSNPKEPLQGDARPSCGYPPTAATCRCVSKPTLSSGAFISIW